MKRALTALAALALIAATPGEVIADLEANGYYIEPGASVSEEVVSRAVSDGRSDGGRLYMIVLADEPPGGATTFSDSTLDLLGDDSYVVTVAPETVGFAENGDFWSTGEMDDAVEASLDGNSDNEVVRLFIGTLTGVAQGGGGSDSDDAGSSGGIPWVWILLLGGAGLLAWRYLTNRNRSRRVAGRMAEVKALAKEKLDEVANDILEMEDEVATSENAEIKQHYQNASAMYSRAMEDTDRAETVPEMLKVSEELDLAIWELDCAEALLDGKEKPARPAPPKPESVVPAQPPPEASTPSPGKVPPSPDFNRRQQRQSGGSNDVLTMLLTMMTMGGMGGRGGGGFGGGFSGGGFPRPPIGGGGGRSRGGGGRSRGGGRRRG